MDLSMRLMVTLDVVIWHAHLFFRFGTYIGDMVRGQKKCEQ